MTCDDHRTLVEQDEALVDAAHAPAHAPGEHEAGHVEDVHAGGSASGGSQLTCSS